MARTEVLSVEAGPQAVPLELDDAVPGTPDGERPLEVGGCHGPLEVSPELVGGPHPGEDGEGNLLPHRGLTAGHGARPTGSGRSTRRSGSTATGALQGARRLSRHETRSRALSLTPASILIIVGTGVAPSRSNHKPSVGCHRLVTLG